MTNNLLKQVRKVLKPFAELVEADETTREGPWICEKFTLSSGREVGCGRTFPATQAVCPACTPEYDAGDVMFDVAGVEPKRRRAVWQSDLKRAARLLEVIEKKLAKGGDV